MIDELVGYLDKCWMRKEVPNFYDLEDRYSVYTGDGDWVAHYSSIQSAIFDSAARLPKNFG